MGGNVFHAPFRAAGNHDRSVLFAQLSELSHQLISGCLVHGNRVIGHGQMVGAGLSEVFHRHEHTFDNPDVVRVATWPIVW